MFQHLILSVIVFIATAQGVPSSFMFLKQPENVTVILNGVAKMSCLFNEMADSIPYWIINGTTYSITTLPDRLIVSIENNGFVLTIARVTVELNFTRFQCQVQSNGEVFISTSGIIVVVTPEFEGVTAFTRYTTTPTTTPGLANFSFLKEPENVTAMINGMVTIPCEFYDDISDSYWRINGTHYTHGNLPSGAHINPIQDGIHVFTLIIETASLRWNGTTFQCVTLHENMEYPSRVGILILTAFQNVFPTTTSINSAQSAQNSSMDTEFYVSRGTNSETLCTYTVTSCPTSSDTLKSTSMSDVTLVQAQFGVSVLASSSVAICLGCALLSGIPALLIGVLGGIRYQKRQIKYSINDAAPNVYSLDNAELERMRAAAL